MLCTLFIFLSAFSLNAFGTVVFIDVNNSINEIKIARENAKKRGEDFVVIPGDDDETRQKLWDMGKASQKAWAKYNKANCYGQMLCGGAFTDAKCQGYQDKASEIDASVAAITSGKLTPERITSAIQSIYDDKKTVSSIIVSGEDGGSVFGAYGTIEYKQLTDALGKVPQLKTDVQSLYLWGCYTGTAERYSQAWKDALPGAKLMAGFFDSGPASTSESGLELLDKMMMAEDAAFKAYTEEAAEDFFNSFRAVSQVNASMCINGRYVDKKNSFLLSDYAVEGEKCIADFPLKLWEKYNCYWNALPGCERSPANTHASELREYYTWLRNNEGCLGNSVFNAKYLAAGSPDSVLRLIYWERVWANFLRNNGQQMKNLNTVLKSVGAPEELHFNLNEKASRADFFKWQKAVNEYLSKRTDGMVSYLKEKMNNLDWFMGNLNKWYIPDEWVTGSSGKQGHYTLDVQATCE